MFCLNHRNYEVVTKCTAEFTSDSFIYNINLLQIYDLVYLVEFLFFLYISVLSIAAILILSI